jgi:polysaccharide chain length determinant protein (PEP-CTERM system associated)
MADTKDTNQTINLNHYIGLVFRHRWLVIIPFCLAMIAGIFLSVTLTRVYEASTLILIQPQKVPTSYVQSLITDDVDSRLNTLSQQIMSRTNLEKIIKELNLFSGPEYEKMLPEDKLASLRGRVTVNIQRGRRRGMDTESFTISFKGTNPDKVMRVTNALANNFINENLKVREAQATGTSEFLDTELNEMRRNLEEFELRLKEYRERHMGELPEQLQSNLMSLESLNQQLVNQREGLLDAKNRLVSVENLIAQSQHYPTAVATAEPEAGGQLSLAQLHQQLNQLLARYTEHHPDVIKLKKQIANYTPQASSEAEETPGTTGAPPIMTQEMRQRDDIRREIAVIEMEISETTRQISRYKKRVENTPKREQELMSLRRDYDNINEKYNSLLERKLEAELAVNMEKKQQGEQFRIIDPATVPQRPIEPDMRKLFLIIVALGLGPGCGLIFALDYFDTSFRRPEDLESYFGIRTLAIAPQIHHRKDRVLRKLHLAFSVLSVMIALLLFSGFASLTFRGVEPTMELVQMVQEYAKL